jgi:hypothetical protein
MAGASAPLPLPGHVIKARYREAERQRVQTYKPFRRFPMTPGHRNYRENEPSTQQKEKARKFQRGTFLFGATLFATFSRARERKLIIPLNVTDARRRLNAF